MTTYTDLFGQNTVPPADAGYYAASISANAYLSWENNFSGATDELLAATFVDLLPSTAGLTVRMPSAEQVSTGTELLIQNSGSDAVSILDNAGNSVASVAPGTIKYFMVTNNATAAGIWAVFTFGTGTSAADAVALAGKGLRVIANKLNAEVAYWPINSNYTVSESNRAVVIDASAGVLTLTLPLGSSLNAGFYTFVRNSSAGNITLSPSGTELLDGLSTKVLAPGESLILICTGLNWISVGFGRDATFVFGEVVLNAATTSITLTSGDVAGRMIRVSGTATANVTVTLPSVDNIYFINAESGLGTYSVTFTTGSGTTTVLAANQKTVVYCDGINVTPAITTSVTSSLSLVDGSAAAPSISWALDANTGFYRKGEGTAGFSANGVNSVSFSPNGVDFTSTAGLTSNNMASALDELKNYVGNYETLSTINTNSTLTVSQAGVALVLVGASPLTITLPTLATLSNGGTYSITNFTTQSCVVQRAAADLISVDAAAGPAVVTSITLAPGDSVALVSSGVGWFSTRSEMNRLRKSGGTLTGPLVLSGDATASLNPVSKQQWDLAKGNFKGGQYYNTNATLPDSSVGQVIVFDGASPVTLTLPLQSSIASGSSFTFVNVGTSTLTVNRAGSDVISTYGIYYSNVILAPGETVQLATTSIANAWYVLGGNYTFIRNNGGQLSGPLYFSVEFDQGSSGTAKTIDFAIAQKQKVTITGNCTFTFSFPGVGNYVLRGIGNGTTYTLTWPAGTKFFGGTAPAAPLTSGTAIYTIYYDGAVAHVAGGRE